MDARELLFVAIAVMALWFISIGVLNLLAAAIGPFAHLAIGAVLHVVALFIAPGRTKR
jgi:hypothetical protein